MTIMRMVFAGQIKRADHKEVGGKKLVECSICRKQKGRNGAEDTFAWLRISVWEPPEFMMPRLVKDAFIAGSGEFSLRSYDDKDGKHKTSAEVRCSSFDVEVAGGDGVAQSAQTHAAPSQPPPMPRVPTRPLVEDDEPPFS